VLEDGALGGNATAAGVPWHRGVLGILASRVVERTGRPALVLASEDGEAYGSGRSTRGFHLLDALTAAHHEESGPPLFTRFGGHAYAVGFSLASDRIATLRERMQRLAETAILTAPATDALECHAALDLHEITPEFLQALETLGPFGHGNAEPLFLSCNVRLTAAAKIVKERHLRLSVEDADTGTRFGGMAWGRRTHWGELSQMWGLTQGSRIDIAFHLRRNWHPEFGGWELEVVALRPSGEQGQE
jgi:single-stranded-DNA-specific exonuclease